MTNKILKEIQENYIKHPLIGSILVFLLVFALSLSFTLTTSGFLFKDDHFFHFKYAYLLKTYGFEINKNFDWMYLTEEIKNSTIHRATFFQIALIPFTLIKNLELGLKISDAFWASTSLSLIYYSFRKLKISYPLLMILLLVASYFSMERFLAGRTFVFSTGLIFILIYLAIREKYFKFLFLSLLFIFWHPAIFFMPVLITSIVEIARHFVYKKINYFGFLGWILSALIASFYYSLDTFLNISAFLKKTFYNVDLGQGAEMHRINIFKIAGFSEIFLLMLIFSFFFVIKRYVSQKKSFTENPQNLVIIYTAFLFVLFSLNGAIMINGRFIDYYGAGVALLTGACITQFKQNKKDFTKNENFFLLGGVLIFIFVIGANTFNQLKTKAHFNDISAQKSVAEWVASHSSTKDRVYLYNWSDFPINFFYNHKNIYAMGMEPMQLYYYNPELYWKWYNIFNNAYYCNIPKDCKVQAEKYTASLKNLSLGEAQKISRINSRKILESIKNDFQAKYIISDEKNRQLFELNPDLIADSFSAKSEINEDTIWAYELK